MLDSNDQIFRKSLSQFLNRYPLETLQYLIKSERIKDSYTFKFLFYLNKTELAFLNVFKNEPYRIINLLNGDLTIQQTQTNSTIPSTSTTVTAKSYHEYNFLVFTSSASLAS